MTCKELDHVSGFNALGGEQVSSNQIKVVPCVYGIEQQFRMFYMAIIMHIQGSQEIHMSSYPYEMFTELIF